MTLQTLWQGQNQVPPQGQNTAPTPYWILGISLISLFTHRSGCWMASGSSWTLPRHQPYHVSSLLVTVGSATTYETPAPLTQLWHAPTQQWHPSHAAVTPPCTPLTRHSATPHTHGGAPPTQQWHPSHAGIPVTSEMLCWTWIWEEHGSCRLLFASSLGSCLWLLVLACFNALPVSLAHARKVRTGMLSCSCFCNHGFRLPIRVAVAKLSQ